MKLLPIFLTKLKATLLKGNMTHIYFLLHVQFKYCLQL